MGWFGKSNKEEVEEEEEETSLEETEPFLCPYCNFRVDKLKYFKTEDGECIFGCENCRKILGIIDL